MTINKTFAFGAVAGLALGAMIAFAVTRAAMADKQIDALTAGVFWGCRNAPDGKVLSDEKRCSELADDMRGMARQEAFKKAHPALPF